MSAPGGGFGESAHRDEANPPPAPWQYPASDYPPPAYGQPSYGDLPVPPPSYGPPPGHGPPPGYGPPPYPGGYYPAPDYAGGYGHPDAMQRGMSGLAIASLISSFVGVFCCLGAITAIVLGAIALNQIKRTRQEGYALAVAGIVIGTATLIVVLIVMIFASRSH
jgi:hypothetical protein